MTWYGMHCMKTTKQTAKQIGLHSLPVIALLLVVFVAASGWQQTYTTYQENKSEVITSFADIAKTLALPYRIAQLSRQPVTNELPVPVYGVRTSAITDTWNASRSNGRSHEGTDIFAERGTPIFSATRGYVTELNIGDRGGKNVMVVGPGGRFYYYAHLEKIANGIQRGRKVTKDTVIGFVGNSGNASGTPPHLHFGIYPEMWEAVNPYPKLVDRW